MLNTKPDVANTTTQSHETTNPKAKVTPDTIFRLRKEGKSLADIAQATNLDRAQISKLITLYFQDLELLDKDVEFQLTKEFKTERLQNALLMSLDDKSIKKMYPSYRVDSIVKLQKMLTEMRNPLSGVTSMNFIQVIRAANKVTFTRKQRKPKAVAATVIDVQVQAPQKAGGG